MGVELHEGERLDDIGFRGLQLIQRPEEFCFGIDAVLLADFAKLKKSSIAIDLGSGTGIIPLILSRKTEAERIIGVEMQEASWDRANRSVEQNGLSHRIQMLHADVMDLPEKLPPESVDAVLSNPPYNESGGAIESRNQAKRIARHETTAALVDFIRVAAGLLKDRGDFYLVHRPSRLVDIFYYCRQWRLEPKEIRFVQPKAGSAPNIVLVHCVKNAGAELKYLMPLEVYDQNGRYTSEIRQIYEKD